MYPAFQEKLKVTVRPLLRMTAAAAAVFAIAASTVAQAGPSKAQAPIPGAPAGQKAVKASRAFRYLDVFLKVPAADRSKIRVNFYLRHDGRPAAGYHPVLYQGGAQTPLPLDASGRFLRTPTLAQLRDKDAFIVIDAPSDANFSAGVAIEANLKPAQEMNAQEVDASLRSVGVVLQKAVGPLAFMAPAFTRASFPQAGSGVAISAAGAETPLPLDHGAPVYDPTVQRGAVRLRFEHVPSKVDLSPAK